MWCHNERASTSLKQFAVGYHKAIKKMLNLSYHESNHYACQEAGLLTFQHLMNVQKFNTVTRLFLFPCTFIQKSLSYLKVSSYLLKDIRNIFLRDYNIEAIFKQDRDAVRARVSFVQNHEDQMREGIT